MITAEQIESKLNLTGVTLHEELGRVTITADQPVTEAMQARVQVWFDAGEVSDAIYIDADLVLSRLTLAEKEALFTTRRTVWQVDYFLTRASTTGIISTSDVDLPAAQALFDKLDIISADRWTDLLTP